MSVEPSVSIGAHEARGHLLLQCHLAVGDIVMLTAAVRDLHRAYPGRFQTSVHTSCREIWDGNPRVTPFGPACLDAHRIECEYPLINQSHRDNRHCLHGFIEHLNDVLDLEIQLTEPRGEVRLTEAEKRMPAQLESFVGSNHLPYWIVSAGGKYDMTAKWWGHERYQEVVDAFRGRIQFVQIGHPSHWHPKLEGVIDLRGRTNLRQLIQLVYRAQGILCPVTGLMHLAAAVEREEYTVGNRPCVVLAGGREPPHWEAYPDHRFLHRVGTLECCQNSGCWKARTVPLGDGDERDEAHRLCENVDDDTPRCMTEIDPQQVVDAIESYFQEGRIHYLTRTQRLDGWRGVDRSRNDEFDERPLTLKRARLELKRHLRSAPVGVPGGYGTDRGIIICASGPRSCSRAFIGLCRLRELGCSLPVEWWSFRGEQIELGFQRELEGMGVRFRNAKDVRMLLPHRRLGSGNALKFLALAYGSFRENLVISPETVAQRDPNLLFELEDFKQTGRMLWAESYLSAQGGNIRQSLELDAIQGKAVSEGAMLIDAKRHRSFIGLVRWFLENNDFFSEHLDWSGILHAVGEQLREPVGLVKGRIKDIAIGKELSVPGVGTCFIERCRIRNLDERSLPVEPLDWVTEGAKKFRALWRGRISVEDEFEHERKSQMTLQTVVRANTLWHLYWTLPTENPAALARMKESRRLWKSQYLQAQWIHFGVSISDMPRIYLQGMREELYLNDLVRLATPRTRRGDIIVVSSPFACPAENLTGTLIERIRQDGVLHAFGVARGDEAGIDPTKSREADGLGGCRLLGFSMDWWEANQSALEMTWSQLGYQTMTGDTTVPSAVASGNGGDPIIYSPC